MLAREYCDDAKRKIKPVVLSHRMMPGAWCPLPARPLARARSPLAARLPRLHLSTLQNPQTPQSHRDLVQTL